MAGFSSSNQVRTAQKLNFLKIVIIMTRRVTFTEYLLCARHCAEFFECIILANSYKSPMT